jgi:hypothetical protein
MGLRKFFIKEKPDFYATLGLTQKKVPNEENNKIHLVCISYFTLLPLRTDRNIWG